MKHSKTSKGNARAKALVKNFRKMGAKKFFERWKQGIESVSPLQQVRGQLIGIIPILIGLIIGIVVTAKAKTTWLILILAGSLIISIFQLLGFLQKFIRLKMQDKLMKMASINSLEVKQ
jgi:hypothetical protein